jgi:2-succinyl-5-enolpyruvyl-6-hydroxy-3-cyclohexene-1-carboxylate synthase
VNDSQSWGVSLIDHLLAHGVRHFCLSPGSRSTALTLAVAQAEQAIPFVHYDERGMAFHALGLAKATKKPVAIIVTSGTAVGNLLPAVMEAHHTHVPLIVLSADRPPELRDNGSSQTTHQVDILGNFVEWQIDLPCPSSELPSGYLESTIAHAVARSHNGPVHLNCMLRKPFVSSSIEHLSSPSTTTIQGQLSFPDNLVEGWSHRLSTIERGVVVVGPHNGDPRPIVALAKKLQWPLIADLSSGIRELGDLFPRYNFVLDQDVEPPETVLHFGGPIVSAKVLEWIKNSSPSLYAHISEWPERIDPLHRVTHTITCEPALFCQQISKELPVKPASGWNALWHLHSSAAYYATSTFLRSKENLTEPGIVETLTSQLSPEISLFIGNSMPIRDADSLLFPSKPIGGIYTNRGLAGIDGNIATAIGVARGSERPTIALLGDTTFLHDLNSLGALQESRWPVIFIIVNNAGGGIFSFLPISEQTPHFERYFSCEHPFTFQKAAEMFQIGYHHPLNPTDWESTLSSAINEKKSCIIEVQTDRTENVAIHKKMVQAVTEKSTNRTKELL